ncbi:DUF4179 domain-containing protein [Terribacillus saccharophilus]|uniref:DUF4179 domain-containing protein n=1 Tax=Terribacillus saccharophilus TaxID=361277 RepID=UPI0039825175
MNKQHFKDEINKVNFPRDEVKAAVTKGIKKGRKEKRFRKKYVLKTAVAISSIAASAFLASGLIFAPVSSALASVPVIGAIYDRFSMQIGHELFESSLITEVNETAKSNGIEITITSAYYDGNVIGLTFKATGDRISLDRIGEPGESEVGYSFHLSNDEEPKQFSASTMTQLEKTSEGYIGAIEFDNPNAELPKNYTLPLYFSSVTGVKGIWKFDVPVKQIPAETIAVDDESIFKDDKDYSIHIKSIAKGKATTMLHYTTTFPLAGKEDEINITAFDNEGNRLSKSHADVLAYEQSDGRIVSDIRELFSSKISEGASYITINPEIRQYEQETINSLERNAPFMIDSYRFDYQIQVNNIAKDGNRLILDYNVQNVDADEYGKDIIQNFADFITLIESNNIVKDENGELDMNQMIEHQIQTDQAKELDNASLHFQSVFTIENDNFNIKDYSLMVPFGTLSSNRSVKLEPIKVKLN